MYQTLVLSHANEGYSTITFNRPEKLNTLSILMRQELAHAVGELERNPDVRVLILTGAGRAFTAGLDLTEWDANGRKAAAAYECDAVAAIEQFSGPVIGAINGLALTGGLEISLACDVLIASSEARFADTHVKVGLLPGWGGSARLLQRLGASRAKELAFTGRVFTADEAMAWGLVNMVCAPEDLLTLASKLACEMLQSAPGALESYKKLLNQELGVPLDEALKMERAASRAHNEPVTQAQMILRLAQIRKKR